MKRAAATLALVAAFAVGACGADENPVVGSGGGTGTEATVAAVELNDADVTFLKGMVPHHEQALEMAQMARSRAASQEVRDLAQRIQDAQDPEITQMNSLLQQQDTTAAGGHDMGGGSAAMEHGGMMSEEQMAALEDAMGAEFDRLFLESMIEHHEGAIAASEDVLADGASSEVKALAEAIIVAQRKEIAEMQELLD